MISEANYYPSSLEILIHYNLFIMIIFVCLFVYLRSPTSRSRHVHDYTFIPISASTTSHRLSFYPRTIVQWNSLPPDVFTFSADLAQFRTNVQGGTLRTSWWESAARFSKS